MLEVAGGDGFLSAALRQAAPGLEVIASDSGAWTDPRARMTARERREFRGINVPGVRLGASVLRLDALAAIRRTRPDLVLASWLPPGALLERLVRAPVRYVLEIGAKDGVTPGAWSWRFAHEFCEEVERSARCRLDERPGRTRRPAGPLRCERAGAAGRLALAIPAAIAMKTPGGRAPPSRGCFLRRSLLRCRRGGGCGRFADRCRGRRRGRRAQRQIDVELHGPEPLLAAGL